jgi:predicted esterase
MRTRSILLLLLAAGFALAAPEKKKYPRWKKGEREGSVTIDGKEEAFVALIPSGFSTKKPNAVVLLLHGNGGKAKSFLKWIKPMAGKRPPLLISLERCDNNQDAVGYVTKYLDQLGEQFYLDENNVYALGFSGGGFRLWDDIVCQEDVLPRFRGVVLVGCGKQSYSPPEKPEEGAPTIVFVGDPKDGNYGKSRPAAADDLKAKGYEVIVHEHNGGHTVPRKETKAVFDWIAKTIKASKKKKR